MSCPPSPSTTIVEEPSRPKSILNEPTMIRSSLFWYQDGNVVLVLQGKRRKIGFKVHGSVLGQRSRVFKDLFDVPKPDFQETVEECPVVELSDDADDFQTFLGLIYTGWEYRGDLSWKVVKVLLVFGDKYDIKPFRKEGIAHLAKAFPRSIEEWDMVNSGKLRCMEYAPLDVLSMAEAVRTLNVPDIYAAILYRCCLLPVDTVFTGRRDSVSKKHVPGLSGESLHRCIKGREALPHLCIKLFEPFLLGLPADGKCWEGESCSRARQKMKLQALSWVSVLLKPPAACNLLRVSVWDITLAEPAAKGICDRCINEHRARWTKLRQEMRYELRGTFGLSTVDTPSV